MPKCYRLLTVSLLLITDLALASGTMPQEEVEAKLGMTLGLVSRAVLNADKPSQDREKLLAYLKKVGTSNYYDALRAHYSETLQECEAGGVNKRVCEKGEADLGARLKFVEELRNKVEANAVSPSADAITLAVMTYNDQAAGVILPKFLKWKTTCGSKASIDSKGCREDGDKFTRFAEKLQVIELYAVNKALGKPTKTVETSLRSLVSENR